jgi:hypothetical protein
VSAAAEPLRLPVAVTRRGLLAAGGAALVVAAVEAVPRWALPGRAAAATAAAAPLARSAFAPLVGTRFTVAGADGRPVALRLDEIGDLAHAADRERAFSLLLHGPREPRLEQAVHRLRHPALADADLLLVLAGTGRHGQDYAVIINSIPHPTH